MFTPATSKTYIPAMAGIPTFTLNMEHKLGLLIQMLVQMDGILFITIKLEQNLVLPFHTLVMDGILPITTTRRKYWVLLAPMLDGVLPITAITGEGQKNTKVGTSETYAGTSFDTTYKFSNLTESYQQSGSHSSAFFADNQSATQAATNTTSSQERSTTDCCSII